jgi:hypothetical protein
VPNGFELRIDKSIITSDIEDECTTFLQDKFWRKQYEIWMHAKDLLDKLAPAEQDCAAALFQLSRAVEFRDKLLAEIYPFKRIPGLPKGLKQHEIMCQLGLILPLMKSKLDAIRNQLMHRPGVTAPPLDVCRELMEFTWYYLRSTDRLCSMPVDYFTVNYSTESDAPVHFLSWRVVRPSWTILVSGWVPEYLIRPSGEGDALVLHLPRAPEVHPESSEIAFKHAELVAPSGQVRHIIDLHFALTLGTIGD